MPDGRPTSTDRTTCAWRAITEFGHGAAARMERLFADPEPVQRALLSALLAENKNPTREDVVRAISGNVCRCTGYESIIRAILDAAERIK